MRVAITGGTGYIGSRLSRVLLDRGDDVLVVRRGTQGAAGVMWDPRAGWVQPGLLDGFDAVVHLSGASIGAKRWTAARRAELRASRIDTTRVLVEHLRTLTRRPRVLISASATGYYGDTDDDAVNEGSARGSGFLAALVTDWEAEASRAGGLGMRVCYSRASPLIARDSELMERMLPPFRLGLGGTLGSGRQWFSWVATDDVLGAYLFMLDHEEMAGPVNVTAPEPVTNAEFTQALARAIHRPAVMRVPAAALRLAFGRPLADEALLASQRVVPERLLASGYEFHYPTIEGALAAAFGERANR